VRNLVGSFPDERFLFIVTRFACREDNFFRTKFFPEKQDNFP
jgi:hypothetical protein